MALTTRATISSIVALSKVSMKRAEPARNRAAIARNIETSNLIADGDASRLVSTHDDRKAGISRKGAARRKGEGHADAQRVNLPRCDHHEAMTILHFAPRDWIRVDPIDVAAARNVAANH